MGPVVRVAVMAHQGALHKSVGLVLQLYLLFRAPTYPLRWNHQLHQLWDKNSRTPSYTTWKKNFQKYILLP